MESEGTGSPHLPHSYDSRPQRLLVPQCLTAGMLQHGQLATWHAAAAASQQLGFHLESRGALLDLAAGQSRDGRFHLAQRLGGHDRRGGVGHHARQVGRQRVGHGPIGVLPTHPVGHGVAGLAVGSSADVDAGEVGRVGAAHPRRSADGDVVAHWLPVAHELRVAVEFQHHVDLLLHPPLPAKAVAVLVAGAGPVVAHDQFTLDGVAVVAAGLAVPVGAPAVALRLLLHVHQVVVDVVGGGDVWLVGRLLGFGAAREEQAGQDGDDQGDGGVQVGHVVSRSGEPVARKGGFDERVRLSSQHWR